MLSHFLRAASKNTNQPVVPQYVGASAIVTAATGTTSITCNVPAGSQAGDLLVIFGLYGNTEGAWVNALPTGWAYRLGGETTRLIATLQGYDGTTTSYTFTKTDKSSALVVMFTFRNAVWDTRGALTATPVTNPVAPAIDPVIWNKSLLLAIGFSLGSVNFGTPTGYTLAALRSNLAPSFGASYRNQLINAGSSGTLTYPTTGVQTSLAFLSSIRPAVSDSNITYIGTTNSTTGANPTVAVPSGVISGDLLLLVGNSGSSYTLPSGWTQLVRQTTGTFLFIAYKFAGSSESSVTVTNASTASSISMLAYRGSSTNPVVGSLSTSTTLTATSISGNPAGSLILSVFSATQSFSENLVVPSGRLRRYLSNAVTRPYAVSEEPLPQTGTTASVTRTAISTNTFSFTAGAGCQISIRP